MRRRAFLILAAAGTLLSRIMRPPVARSAVNTSWEPYAAPSRETVPVLDTPPEQENAPDQTTAGEPTTAVKRDTAAATKATHTIDAAGVAELNRKGQLLIRSSALGPLLLIRDPATKQLQAVNPTCPHRGCTVAWKSGTESFLCPCHQARFNVRGRWIDGQTVKRPLPSFRVTVSNGGILVSPG